jgi:tetratricopeptide (TPR) repeat protein
MGRHLQSGLLFCILLATLSGCAGREFIVRGDELLKEGRYKEAIVYYEKARELVPDNNSVLSGIKQARIMAIKDELDKADKLMKDIDYAGALSHALRASKMPLELDEVALQRRIRDAVSSAEKRAEDRVQDWVNRGHYVPAVELADMIVDASRGMASRKKWAADLRQDAQGFFEKRAADTQAASLPGSAALQSSIAQTLGAKIDTDALMGNWASFAGPVCFGAIDVQVQDKSGKLGDMAQTLKEGVVKKLSSLQKRCGNGERTLSLTLNVNEVKVTDTTSTEKAAKPFPGVRIATEEVYYEEVPYIVVEEVTEEEIRIEKVERRDCAPRPGKPRGCVTWLEDVEKKVPVKVKKEVEKIKKVERRRPVKNLPADKVLSYELTRVIRAVSMSGTISVAGSEQKPVAFRVLKESRDTSNDEVKHARMTIAADAMKADTLAVVKENASKEVARATARASARAIRTWMRDVRTQAQQAAADTKMNQAEELYLQLIALGIPADDQLKRFFKTRYGQSLDEIFNPLSIVLGRELVVDRDAQKRRRKKFPSKMPSAGKFPKKVKKPEPAKSEAPVAPVAAETVEAAEEPVAVEPTNEVDDAFDSALGTDEDDAPEEDFGSVDDIMAEKEKQKKSTEKKAKSKDAPKKDGEKKADKADEDKEESKTEGE